MKSRFLISIALVIFCSVQVVNAQSKQRALSSSWVNQSNFNNPNLTRVLTINRNCDYRLKYIGHSDFYNRDYVLYFTASTISGDPLVNLTFNIDANIVVGLDQLSSAFNSSTDLENVRAIYNSATPPLGQYLKIVPSSRPAQVSLDIVYNRENQGVLPYSVDLNNSRFRLERRCSL